MGGITDTSLLLSKRIKLAASEGPLNIAEIVAEQLGDEARIDLSYIYAYHDGRTKAQIWSSPDLLFDCMDGVEVMAGGSGAYSLLHEHDLLVEVYGCRSAVLTRALERLANMYWREVTDQDAYYYRFGVGYEVTVPSGGGWRKLPYSMNVNDNAGRRFGPIGGLSVNSLAGNAIFSGFEFELGNPKYLDLPNWRYLDRQPNMKRLAHLFLLGESHTDIEGLMRTWAANSYSLEEPEFSITLLLSRGALGLDPLARVEVPGVRGLLSVGRKNLFGSWAFHERDVEAYYHRRPYKPKPEQEAFYRETRQAWAGGRR